MSFKVVGWHKIQKTREYLFKDYLGCFYLGEYADDYGITGFYTDMYDFIEMNRIRIVWELPDENS